MRQPTPSGRFSKMPQQLTVELRYLRRHEVRKRKIDSKPNRPLVSDHFKALHRGWIVV